MNTAVNPNLITKITTDFQDYQFLPPFSKSEDFEIFAEDLFNEIYNVRDFKKRGRNGQMQGQYDVSSYSQGIYVECKLKGIAFRREDEVKKELIDELRKSIKELQTNGKNSTLKTFYLLSNFPGDSEIEDVANELSNKKIKVLYWDWEKILRELSKCPSTLDKYKPELLRATRDYYEIRNVLTVKNSERDNNKSALELIKEFQKTFYPLSAFKPNFLQNIFPFNNTDKYNHSRRWYFDIKNRKVKSFFQNIYLNKNKKLHHKSNRKVTSAQLEDILDLCGNNLYYFIEGKEPNQSMKLPIQYNEHCNCIRCNFYNLDFENLFNHLKTHDIGSKQDSDIDKLKHAFINFKIGNFKTAYLQLKNVAAHNGQNHEVLGFLCHYNMQNIYFQIQAYYEGSDKEVILKDIEKNYSTNKIILNCKSKEVREQLSWINEDAYVKDIALKIDSSILKINESIRMQYNAQGATDELLDAISITHSAIQSNYLFYDIYDSFETLVAKSLDGVVGAYSVQDLVFEHRGFRGFPISKYGFNDFLFNLMIFHCGTNALKGIFKKYPLLELKSSKNAVVNKFKNLIKTYSYARKIISNQIKKKNYFFEHKFQRIIANLFIVLSKLKIENSEYIEISKLFIDFFKIETNIAWHAVDNIQYIIFKSDNSTLFTAEQLEELINITYVKPYGKHGLLQIFAEALEKYYPKYTLRSNRIYSIIVRNYSEDKFSDLISLWRISDSKTKLKISKFFLDKMTNKFDDELYSYVALETIVDYKPFFKQYLIKLLPYKNIWGYERVGNNLVSYYPPLNWIISFVYKFQIDTKSEELKELAQSHEYFNWLLNLETFDYSKFKLEWIAVYEHISYFQKFKTIPVLKLQIEKKLKEHYDSFLSEIYYKKIG